MSSLLSARNWPAHFSHRPCLKCGIPVVPQDLHARLGLVRFYAHPKNRYSIIAAYIVDQTNSLVLTELDPCASSLGVQPTPEPILLKDIQEFVKEGAGKPIMTVQINPQYHQEVLWFLPEEEQT